MLEALVDRQDHQLARARQRAVIQHGGDLVKLQGLAGAVQLNISSFCVIEGVLDIAGGRKIINSHSKMEECVS